MKFYLKTFDELSKEELYRILQLRQEVFIVEQDCPYLDADDKDHASLHVLGFIDDELQAYTRLVPAGVSYKAYSSIGRVVTSKKLRGLNVGRQLMEESILKCLACFPDFDIKISAQSYLKNFYEKLGFVPTGEEYLEDGIPHMAMILKNISID